MPQSILTPAESIAPDLEKIRGPDKGIAICLSGGGYRAMLFHLGSLWRLQELGLLNCTASAPCAAKYGSLERVSSVSGGSITAGQLALRWQACTPSIADARARYEAFRKEVVSPIRKLAGISLAGTDAAGAWNVIKAVLEPGSVSTHIAEAYAEYLYGKATLQDLPDEPRFVINASNLQSGALWRFMKPYMRDWRVGEIKNPVFSLARAVAASCAFPPPLSPATFEFKESDYTPNSGGSGNNNLQRPPFTTHVQLSDGGVYDNLGLETAWKHYRTLLVSNAGKPFQFEEKPGINWLSQSARVIGVMDNQVRSLRVRQLIESFKPQGGLAPLRTGAYWGIDSDMANFPCQNPLPAPLTQTERLAAIATDLAHQDDATQERLINWGYAACDAAVRSYLDSSLPTPADFPYPRGVS